MSALPRRIWLVDFDGKMENLALMRLSSWLKKKGASVVLKRGEAYPELWDTPDQVYISCLFRWHEARVRRYTASWNGRAIVGGTGVDLTVRLPTEAIACEPDYDLYGGTRAIGFISRGCIRNCPWCIVPEKEGRLRRVSTAAEIVQDKTRALFLDNNFLALGDFATDLLWLADHDVAIDFNQGLDCRLVDKAAAKLLARCRWLPGSTLRLALDSKGQSRALGKAVARLTEAGVGPERITVFVLIGFSGIESDVERLLFAHSLGTRVFPMGFRDLSTGGEPARGWPLAMYRKYRRLICRIPQSESVWNNFREALGR